jgi:hypothetical protein
MIYSADFDATRYSSAGIKLPGYIRLQELARNLVYAGYIELVRHIQYLLCTEASPCGNYLLSRLMFTILC